MEARAQQGGGGSKVAATKAEDRVRALYQRQLQVRGGGCVVKGDTRGDGGWVPADWQEMPLFSAVL